MRGKPHLRELIADFGGLIPAHAGKTEVRRPSLSMPGAHPRACGENSSEFVKWVRVRGSSPRMRGKLIVAYVGFWCVGLIPAHAGKTGATSSWGKQAGAHPRACGENVTNPPFSLARVGSSPRMRGKRVVTLWSLPGVRLIPAHAGKTRGSKWTYNPQRAHPRACGENPPGLGRAITVVGSSPRMRGKRKGLAG